MYEVAQNELSEILIYYVHAGFRGLALCRLSVLRISESKKNGFFNELSEILIGVDIQLITRVSPL